MREFDQLALTADFDPDSPLSSARPVVLSPSADQFIEFEARVTSVSQRSNQAAGGFAQEHSAVARWPKDGGPTPREGMLFREADSETWLRVDEIQYGGEDPEYRVGLGPVVAE